MEIPQKSEILTISRQPLGNVILPKKGDKYDALSMEVFPFTVVIGAQGTGKSLLSQILYCLRDAPYLIKRYSATNYDIDVDQAVRIVVEGLRTGRLFSRVGDPTIHPER